MANVIAIDGPSGAGKSSVSRIVGEKLGYLHVDSGALYRIMTWQCLENRVDTSDPGAVAAFAAQVEIECRPENGAIAYYVKGEAPGNRIRTPEINAHASQVATVKEVRDRITAILRGMTAQGNLVVEGRDITTAVFPDSPARFYLTASAEADYCKISLFYLHIRFLRGDIFYNTFAFSVKYYYNTLLMILQVIAKINSFSENIIEYLYHICHSTVVIRAYDIVGVLERLRRTVFRDESCFCRD